MRPVGRGKRNPGLSSDLSRSLLRPLPPSPRVTGRTRRGKGGSAATGVSENSCPRLPQEGGRDRRFTERPMTSAFAEVPIDEAAGHVGMPILRARLVLCRPGLGFAFGPFRLTQRRGPESRPNQRCPDAENFPPKVLFRQSCIPAEILLRARARMTRSVICG
jgi:hypothetical protein